MQKYTSLLSVHHQSAQDVLALFGVSRAGLSEEDIILRGGSLARPKTCRIAIVRRHNHIRCVDADGLVEGDIVLLRPGYAVYADGRLLVASGLRMDELSIFGNTNVQKQLSALLPETIPINATNMVFAGSLVCAGAGEYVVTTKPCSSLCTKFTLCNTECPISTHTPLLFIENGFSERQHMCLHATLGDEYLLNPNNGVFESIGGRYEKAVASFLQTHPLDIGLRTFYHPMDSELGVAIGTVETVCGRIVFLAGEADTIILHLDITDKEHSQILKKIREARKKQLLPLILAETQSNEQAPGFDKLGNLSYVGMALFSVTQNKNFQTLVY